MRRALLLIPLLAASAFAAEPPQLPPGLQPVPEPPPPPPGYELNPALEPEVTITTTETQRVEEFRIGGRLYMIKVTPRGGPPFYLVDQKGDGNFSRMDHLDSGFRPPQWVIFQF